MKRIMVTGNAGSGKSTLARRIATRLSLPLHGLDGVVWQPGWKKRAPEERSALIRKLVDQEAWVIDGVSFEVQSCADAVVFLDVPRRISFLRVMKRNGRYLFRSRPGLPEKCPEVLVIPKLFRIIWNFPKDIRPRILNGYAGSQRFFHVRNPSDLAACLIALDSRDTRENHLAKDVTPDSSPHHSTATSSCGSDRAIVEAPAPEADYATFMKGLDKPKSATRLHP